MTPYCIRLLLLLYWFIISRIDGYYRLLVLVLSVADWNTGVVTESIHHLSPIRIQESLKYHPPRPPNPSCKLG